MNTNNKSEKKSNKKANSDVMLRKAVLASLPSWLAVFWLLNWLNNQSTGRWIYFGLAIFCLAISGYMVFKYNLVQLFKNQSQN